MCTCHEAGETAHRAWSETDHINNVRHVKALQLTISLNFFIGSTRTVLLAGLALKTHGSLVKGLTPLRAATAGFFFSFMFKTPPSLNLPFFFNSEAASSKYEVTTAFTFFGFNSVDSATLLKAALMVMAPPPAAFMAFMDFIAGAIVDGSNTKAKLEMGF